MHFIRTLILVAVGSASGAQVSGDVTSSRFEVDSVKLSAAVSRGRRSGCKGGLGSTDPGTWTCEHISLEGLINIAYDLAPYQFKPPDWMSQVFVDVSAKLPPAAAKDDFRQMQQQLLQDRFHLL